MLILGLGIGANTAIFSVVRAVLLRPLPFAEPDRLVRLYESFGTGGDEAELSLAPLTWQRWRESNAVFEDIGAATGTSLTLGGEGEAPQYVPGARVSFNFFSVLGVEPVRGRDFLDRGRPAGARPGRAARPRLVAAALRRRGRRGTATCVLDGVPHTIVGVMPESFRHPYRAELWVPLALRIEPVPATGRFLYAPARLKPGVSLDEARRAMAELCARIERESPSPTNAREAAIVPLREGFVRDLRPKLARHHRRRRLRAADRGGERREPAARAPRRARGRDDAAGRPRGLARPARRAASCWRASCSPAAGIAVGVLLATR